MPLAVFVLIPDLDLVSNFVDHVSIVGPESGQGNSVLRGRSSHPVHSRSPASVLPIRIIPLPFSVSSFRDDLDSTTSLMVKGHYTSRPRLLLSSLSSTMTTDQSARESFQSFWLNCQRATCTIHIKVQWVLC